MRVIDGAAVSHASECEDEARRSAEQHNNRYVENDEEEVTLREDDVPDDLLQLENTRRSSGDDEQRRSSAMKSPSFISVTAEQDGSSNAQPTMELMETDTEDPDVELSPPRKFVSIDAGSASSPNAEGDTVAPRSSSQYQFSTTTPLGFGGNRSATRYDEPSPLHLTETMTGGGAGKESQSSSRPPSRAASDAPLMMSATLQQLHSEDSQAGGVGNGSIAAMIPPSSIPSSSAFASFESSARSARIAASAHHENAGGGTSTSFHFLGSPPSRSHSNSAVLWVPASPKPSQSEELFPSADSDISSNHSRRLPPRESSSGVRTRQVGTPPPILIPILELLFQDSTDVTLTEHRYRNHLVREFQLSWRLNIVALWESVAFPLVDGEDETVATETLRLAFRWNTCADELEECLREEWIRRSLIESDQHAAETEMECAARQSLRVVRGLGPLKRQLLRYAYSRRQAKAARDIRLLRCFTTEDDCRRSVEAEHYAERNAMLFEAATLQEEYYRHQLYRLYASVTIATMHGWLWLLQRCELYPICFAAPLSAVLRVSGRVCDASLFHLLAMEESAARSTMERNGWEAFHISMRAHVGGAILELGEEVALRQALEEEEIEGRWMLCITRFKVMNMHQRRELEFTSFDARMMLAKQEATARSFIQAEFASNSPSTTP